MNSKFSNMQITDSQISDSENINYEENNESLEPSYGEDELHFSSTELMKAKFNPYLAKVIKEILLTVLFTGLTYGGIHLLHDVGLARETIKAILTPCLAGASIFGTKSLNDIFAYLVAKIKGVDMTEEVYLNPTNPSVDFVRRVENKFDKEYIDKMTFINEEESRRR